MGKSEIFVPMKNLLIILFFGTVLTSCNVKRGSGDIVSRNFDKGSFNKVSISGPFKVEIRNGPYRVEVEADDNLIRYIDVDVSGSTLRVKTTRKNFRNAHLNVYINAPSIEAIKASMAAEVSTSGQISSGSQIVFEASSAAEIRADADAPRVNARASSGAEIELRGRTRELEVSSSSGSDINAMTLSSETASASASSGSEAAVHASRLLNASASSGGTVRYRGGAQVTSSASSGGEVVRVN